MTQPTRILARSVGLAALYAALGPIVGYGLFWIGVVVAGLVPGGGLIAIGAGFGGLVAAVSPGGWAFIFAVGAPPAAVTGLLVGIAIAAAGQLATLVVAALSGFLAAFAWVIANAPGDRDPADTTAAMILGVLGATTAVALTAGTIQRRPRRRRGRRSARGVGLRRD